MKKDREDPKTHTIHNTTINIFIPVNYGEVGTFHCYAVTGHKVSGELFLSLILHSENIKIF